MDIICNIYKLYILAIFIQGFSIINASFFWMNQDLNSSCPHFKRHIAYCLHVVLYKKYYAYNCQYCSHKHSIFFLNFPLFIGICKACQRATEHKYTFVFCIHALAYFSYSPLRITNIQKEEKFENKLRLFFLSW